MRPCVGVVDGADFLMDCKRGVCLASCNAVVDRSKSLLLQSAANWPYITRGGYAARDC